MPERNSGQDGSGEQLNNQPTTEQPESSEEFELALLNKINSALAELGSTAKYKIVPEFKAGYAGLEGKTVVLVDDLANVIEDFLAHFMVATRGKATFVKYDQEDIQALMVKILEKNPDIILMDYNLSSSLKGPKVLELLQNQGFQGKSIGFSSDPGTTSRFLEAGAIGGVDKGVFDASIAVAKVAHLVNKHQ